jgi:DNA-binding CsgD family transcriptional regulator
MPTESETARVWERLTVARVRVLAELAEGRTEREGAERLGVSYPGFRSQVDDLKTIVGCGSVRELGRWWRVNRRGWHAWIGHMGGVGS